MYCNQMPWLNTYNPSYPGGRDWGLWFRTRLGKKQDPISKIPNTKVLVDWLEWYSAC
jgi:hypothetical protein